MILVGGANGVIKIYSRDCFDNYKVFNPEYDKKKINEFNLIND